MMKKTLVLILCILLGIKTTNAQKSEVPPKEVPSVSGQISSNVGAIELKSGVWDIVIPVKNNKAVHVVILANDTVFFAFKKKNPGYIAIISDAVPINKVHVEMLGERYEKKFLLMLKNEGYYIATNWEVKEILNPNSNPFQNARPK